jgi:hypothetical protein
MFVIVLGKIVRPSSISIQTCFTATTELFDVVAPRNVTDASDFDVAPQKEAHHIPIDSRHCGVIRLSRLNRHTELGKLSC